jgi:hypothetical protein
MTTTTPPADTSSLLVPVHLDAWVVDPQSQQVTAIYKADYTRLAQFKGLLDPPFSPSTVSKSIGVHLHWALPDALTHGRTPATGGDETVFPLVPNRWLVARFNGATGTAWQCKLWVVQSDYMGGIVGKTSAPLVEASETTIKLAAGSQLKIGAGDKLQIISPDGTFAEEVDADKVAEKGATSISIRPHDFSKYDDGLVAGSSIRLLASSAFLDPNDPTVMKVTQKGQASFDVNPASIGKRHDIASWQAAGGADGGPLFLQAVGPGNVSFAAYKPAVHDVFSFTDTDLPNAGTGIHFYTYMVVGWYSEPSKGDPLRGVTAYDSTVWTARQDWEKQSPEQRMAVLLSYLKWSVKDQNGNAVAVPKALSTSLYHGLIASVQWPPPRTSDDPGKIDRKNVHVAVGNTAADALAALVQSEARARAAADAGHASQWTRAGDTLAQLMQATMYDLLDKYDKPGGAALVEQQIEQAWFGSAPGGTIWEVVASAQSSQQTAEPPQLTPSQSAAVAAALAGLNSAQAAFDESKRGLMSLQTQLYQMWWKVGRARSYAIYDSAPPTKPRWSVLKTFLLTLYEPLLKATWKQYCAVEQARKALPDPTATDDKDPRSPGRWAADNTAWLFPDEGGVPKKMKLAELGLYLKASAMPNFSHPSDPVLMVSGLNRSQRHGEDGRYNEDGTVTCRVPGQSITGLNIPGQPSINVQTVTTGGVNLTPCSFASIPSVPSLLAEAFFVDPANAPAIARAVPGSDEAKIKTAITNLLAEKPAAGTSWAGTAPTPFSVETWDQAWSPLFLEWKVLYYPTGKDKFIFSSADWQFDGAQYGWLGTGFRPDTFTDYNGRTLLTPYAPLTFKAKIENYLKSHEAIGSEQLKALITSVAGWDILSQNLSGLTDQMITLLSQETFPPPPSDDAQPVQCPPGEKQPGVAELIGNQYHSVPVVETTESKTFFPVRAGFAQFSSLQIVDAFGQVYGGRGDMSVWNNTPQGFQPTLGQGLRLSVAPTVPAQKAQDALKLLQSTSAKFQLPPRVVQSARVDLDFLANDGSGKPASVSPNPNPVCGWLVPNHIDGGMNVYDESGAPLGELLALPPGTKCDNWRPRPGAPGTNPPPTCPADIKNAALRSVVQSIAAQSPDAFRDLLKTIDETLWMVDPLGGRKDQFLSVLIGRPLAVVQLKLKLSLLGDPVFNQFWNKTSTPQTATDASQCSQLKDTGGVLDLSFPVRLGSLELRDDGLIGYYLSTDNYANFYAVHYPDDVVPGDKYLRRIVDPAPATDRQPYQGNVFLKCNGDAVTVTMLIDPRGRVHAYTGILPVVSTALPGQLIEEFIRGLQVTFRTGPVVADPSTLRIPQPAEDHGIWSWVQATAPPTGGQGTTWTEEVIVNADDQARIPDAQLQLREGWLKLSGLKEAGR